MLKYVFYYNIFILCTDMFYTQFFTQKCSIHNFQHKCSTTVYNTNDPHNFQQRNALYKYFQFRNAPHNFHFRNVPTHFST